MSSYKVIRHRSRKSLAGPLIAAVAVGSLLVAGIVWITHYASRGSGPVAQLVAAPLASRSPSVTPTPSAAPVGSQVPAASNPLIVYSLRTSFPNSGPGTFRYASTTGPILGTAGPIHRFGVAIESNISSTIVDMADFTAKVDATLGDGRSWVGSRQYRLQQVPENSPHQFTIYLSTPSTVNHLCAPLPTGGYTSCREGQHVVLNLARWMTSVPYYTSDRIVLDTYRSYMINHEVGHALGHGHELCPGPGRPAPVMQQQTLGLHGCEPNAWVFVHGKKYDGPPGRY